MVLKKLLKFFVVAILFFIFLTKHFFVSTRYDFFLEILGTRCGADPGVRLR